MDTLRKLNKIAIKYNYKNWVDMVNNSTIDDKKTIFFAETDMLLDKAMAELNEYNNSPTAKFKKNYKVKTKKKWKKQ